MTAYIKKSLPAVRQGFTLIELLIVMAILGVLAVVVLVAINPAEQMRRARDTGKISGVQQLGRAVQAYYTANGAVPAVGTWSTDLTASQELTQMPAGITVDGASGCGGNLVNSTWCYNPAGGVSPNFTLSSQLFSQQRIQQCVAAGPGGPAYSIFSSVAGRGGIFCGGVPGPADSPTI